MPTIPIDYPGLPDQSVSYQIVRNATLPPSFADRPPVADILIVAATVSMGDPTYATAAIDGIARVHPLGNAALIFDASSMSGGSFIVPDMLAFLTRSAKPVPGEDVVEHEYVHTGNYDLKAQIFSANEAAILHHLDLLAAECGLQVDITGNGPDGG
jgi:hypothetical protein